MLTYKFSLFTRNILIGEKINGRTRYSQVRQLQKVFFPTLPCKMKNPLVSKHATTSKPYKME